MAPTWRRWSPARVTVQAIWTQDKVVVPWKADRLWPGYRVGSKGTGVQQIVRRGNHGSGRVRRAAFALPTGQLSDHIGELAVTEAFGSVPAPPAQHSVGHSDCEVPMYHRIVKRRIISVFERLSRGDYEDTLSGAGTTIEHRFAGEHSLGGTRTSTTTIRQWFERLLRLFPNLRFEMHSIAVSGGPWDTTVVVEWTDRATPADGKTT